MVYEENEKWCKELIVAGKADEDVSAPPEEVDVGNDTLAAAKDTLTEDENLSLGHCYTLSSEAAMQKLRMYPGIGVKTVACVALFCRQRPCFVLTHKSSV